MKRKQNISNQADGTEQLSHVLEKLRNDAQGFRVPDGYFDSLSPRIIDRLGKQENRSLVNKVIHSFGKPLVWAPSLATVLVAVLLIFVVPVKKASTLQVVDEWTEINMAYDASYAEEALFAESVTIDKELASSVISNKEPISFTQKEPTLNEIKEYLKEHETDTDILNEY